MDFQDTSSPYQLLQDFFLVWVDKIWESKTTKSGIITSNTAIHNSSMETTESGAHKRRYGYVVEAPAGYSDRHFERIDPGLPTPRAYVGHDVMQMARLAGVRGFREHEHPEKMYYPSTFQYAELTIADMAKSVDVRKGDLIYMLPTATDMERYMGPYKDGHLFSVKVTEILCKVVEKPVFEGFNKYKKKQILAQGRWVLVEVDTKDWKKTTIAGTEVLLAPEGETLTGRAVSGHGLDGKRIIFERDADAPVEIEGRELAAMEYRDVLATIKQ